MKKIATAASEEVHSSAMFAPYSVLLNFWTEEAVLFSHSSNF